MQRRSVDLPLPLGPITTSTSPARDLEVDAVQHEIVPEALHDAVEPQQRLVRRLDGGHTGRLTPFHPWLSYAHAARQVKVAADVDRQSACAGRLASGRV